MGVCEPIILTNLLGLETRVACPVCRWHEDIRSWDEHEAQAVFEAHLPLHGLLHPYVLAEWERTNDDPDEPRPVLGGEF